MGDGFFKFEFWEMTARVISTFIVLLILARFLGKKQISQLTFFHYVTGITIGSIAGEVAAQSETPFINGIYAMALWAVLTYAMNLMTLKSKKVRVLLDDEPTVIMHNGKLNEQAMKKERLNLNDLNMMLREQGIFSIKDVNYAILETNGQLSVLVKADQGPATKKDVKAPAPDPKYIPTEIISDGKVQTKNLQELGLTEQWLNEQLKSQGIGKAHQVFYAEIQQDGSLHVDQRSA